MTPQRQRSPSRISLLYLSLGVTSICSFYSVVSVGVVLAKSSIGGTLTLSPSNNNRRRRRLISPLQLQTPLIETSSSSWDYYERHYGKETAAASSPGRVEATAKQKQKHGHRDKGRDDNDDDIDQDDRIMNRSRRLLGGKSSKHSSSSDDDNDKKKKLVHEELRNSRSKWEKILGHAIYQSNDKKEDDENASDSWKSGSSESKSKHNDSSNKSKTTKSSKTSKTSKSKTTKKSESSSSGSDTDESSASDSLAGSFR